MIAEVDELASVLREMADAMTARRVMLSIHPTESRGAVLGYIHDDHPLAAEEEGASLAAASAFAVEAKGSRHLWREPMTPGGDHILLISVSEIEGHSRLIISLFFEALTDQTRLQAEQVFERRRPFAVGYFRLWQLDRIRRRRAEALKGALDLTDIGVLLIARSGNITFANTAAEKALAAGDGLRRINGILSATDLGESVRLQVAINHVTALAGSEAVRDEESEAASILALHRKSGPPLVISLLAPKASAIEPSDVAVVMFVVDPQLNTAQMLEPVCRLYCLSPVETQLTSHIAQGKTLALAAEKMRIKEQTARGYLKQIFAKTSTNRQTELVVLMLSSVVRMRNGLTQKALGNFEVFR